MNYSPNKDELRELISLKLSRYFGASLKDATKEQIYKASAMIVKDILIAKRSELKNKINESKAKRLYYISIEFLLGRSLKNHIYNLSSKN